MHILRDALLPHTVTLYTRKKDGRWVGNILRRVQIVQDLAGCDANGRTARAGRVIFLAGEVEASKPYMEFTAWQALDAAAQGDYWTLPADGKGVLLPGEGDPVEQNPLALPDARPIRTRTMTHHQGALFRCVLSW